MWSRSAFQANLHAEGMPSSHSSLVTSGLLAHYSCVHYINYRHPGPLRRQKVNRKLLRVRDLSCMRIRRTQIWSGYPAIGTLCDPADRMAHGLLLQFAPVPVFFLCTSPPPPALLAARWWLLWCRPHRLTAPPLIVWLPAITADGRYGDGPTATFLFRRAPNLTSLPLIRGPHRSLLIQKEFLYPNMKRSSSLGHLYECRTRI
jgi:hypothetical protein